MAAIVILRDMAEDGSPAVPAGWSANVESGGWSTIYTPGGHIIHAWMAVDGADVGQPTRAVYVVVSTEVGVIARLRDLADASPNAWTFADLRADGGARATAIKAAWRDQRQRDTETGDVIDDGRPLAALRSTIAGYSHHEDEVAP